MIQNAGSTPDAQTFDLPSGAFDKGTGWDWKGLGMPAGSKGYKYIDRGQTRGPCKVVNAATPQSCPVP